MASSLSASSVPTSSISNTNPTAAQYNLNAAVNKNTRSSSVIETPSEVISSDSILGSSFNATSAPSNQKETENQSNLSTSTAAPQTQASSNINLSSQQTSHSTLPKASSLFSNSSMFTFDPWTECLSIFFSYEFIVTKCPQARLDAWPFIYTRLQQLLPFVDPNEPHEIPRTSILFGGGANSLEKIRKAANERDANLNLWKNYLIGACCLTAGADKYLYFSDYEKAQIKKDDTNESTLKAPVSSMPSTNIQTSSNTLPASLPSNAVSASSSSTASAMNVDFTVFESTSKFYTTFGTAVSLLKMIVPFIKCECNYFRELIIRGLGRINIEAIRELIEELFPFIKECSDKRQEKLRRMKKRDVIRLTIVRIFELMAEQRTFGKRLVDAATPKPAQRGKVQTHQQQQHHADEQMLRKMFNDFVDSIYSYLDQESEKYSDFIVQIRLHFSLFLHKLIDSVSNEKRGLLIAANTRCQLFYLCDKWSGKFSLMQHQHLTQPNNQVNNGLLSLSR